MTLDQAREAVGRYVFYVPADRPPEGGIITSVNDTYVFVRYLDDKGSKATRPEDLRLAS